MAVPRAKLPKFLAAGALVLLAALLWIGLSGGASDGEVPAAGEKEAPRRESVVKDSPGRDWQALVSAIESGSRGEDLARLLAETKRKWCEDDPRATAERIAILLREGEDRETGLVFETGHGGGLRSWPTLRVFLLDVLMSTDPDLAGEVAREVLASTDSAEEFAVAMRALVMGKPWRASDAELQARLNDLLAREDWQAEGRPGFAEAMDLVRETGTAAAFRSLAEWVDGGPDFREAGEMALHEFAAEHPDMMVSELASGSGLLDSDPGLRAGLMARADPANPDELKAVEGYLGDGSVTLAEKRGFLRLFPLRSATTGHRLYGGTPMPYSLERVKASDIAAAGAVGGWIENGSYPALGSELESLRSRLETWTRQAREAGGE